MKDKQLVIDELKDFLSKLNLAKTKIDLNGLAKELADLQEKMKETTFWDDPAEASAVSQKASHLELKIESWNSIIGQLEEAIETAEGLTEVDFEVFSEEFEVLLVQAKKLYLETLLTGRFDRNAAILSVICGTGGKDAQDFTEMLAKMYVKYAEKQGFSLEKLDETRGEEVGLKNISFLISGENAYGYLKTEHGVHRLVRLSAFNSGNTRETSFAMVDVIPDIELSEEVEINPIDLRIDVFRASGAGGQHVNTTDSAVRITHLPTGIVVSSQNDRSQHKNKETALKMLYGKLHQLMSERNLSAVSDLRGIKTEMSWGNQIRSYVLHPYKMVKDHRTSHEVSDVDKVLNGEIQDFIEAKLVG